MTDRKFYRTTYIVTVLAEGEPHNTANPEEIAHDISEGNFVGSCEMQGSPEELNGPQAVQWLNNVGSDAGFFGLTEDGEDHPDY